MKDYKRLTFKKSKNISSASYDELLNRLVDLEDKIENGTLIEAESTCTEGEFDYICKYYENGLCHLGEELFGTPPQFQLCDCINDFENCMGSKPIEYEKESSPYRLNSTEVNVFSKLFKEYRKDQDKLDKLVEAFETYLSNAVKSPANAEGKCDNEDTLYRIIKERVKDKAEQLFTIGSSISNQDLVCSDCERVIFIGKKLGNVAEVDAGKITKINSIKVNGIKFRREK